MAEVFPSFENIDRLKVKPTEGEIFLVNWLVEHLSDEFEVYFQPFLNGDMPDIIIMKRESGVIIIEVKEMILLVCLIVIPSLQAHYCPVIPRTIGVG